MNDDRSGFRVPRLAAAGIVLSGDRVLLVRRATEPYRGRWTFPGGRVRFGETLREACLREIREETGLEVEVGPVVEVYEAFLPSTTASRSSGFHYVIVDLLCRPAAEGPPIAGSDADEVRWIETRKILQPTDGSGLSIQLTEGVPQVLRKALALAAELTS